MILPNNGKVIIFDDQENEVKGLIRALSKERIPIVYYQDEFGSDLPESPIENIRMIFLDLQLVSYNLKHDKDIVSTIYSRFKQTLTKHNTYILIYWSTKEEKYKKIIETAFENELKDYKPTISLSLNKAEALNSDDIIKYIINSLNSEMAKYTTLNSLMLWESCTNDAGGGITNELSAIFNKDANWDKNMKNLLFQIAKAESGTDVVKNYNDTERLKTAFDLIGSLLFDSIKSKIEEKLEDISLVQIKEGGSGLSQDNKVILNTKLHLVKSNSFQHFCPGNLYVKDIDELGKTILKENFKNSKLDEIKAAGLKSLSLDITPSCDYSQGKKFTRILSGILIDGKYSHKDLKEGDFKYKLCPIMSFFDRYSYIIFDYRYLFSFSQKEFEASFTLLPNFRIRKNLLFDIQAQLSNHINRPGVVTI